MESTRVKTEELSSTFSRENGATKSHIMVGADNKNGSIDSAIRHMAKRTPNRPPSFTARQPRRFQLPDIYSPKLSTAEPPSHRQSPQPDMYRLSSSSQIPMMQETSLEAQVSTVVTDQALGVQDCSSDSVVVQPQEALHPPEAPKHLDRELGDFAYEVPTQGQPRGALCGDNPTAVFLTCRPPSNIAAEQYPTKAFEGYSTNGMNQPSSSAAVYQDEQSGDSAPSTSRTNSESLIPPGVNFQDCPPNRLSDSSFDGCSTQIDDYDGDDTRVGETIYVATRVDNRLVSASVSEACSESPSPSSYSQSPYIDQSSSDSPSITPVYSEAKVDGHVTDNFGYDGANAVTFAKITLEPTNPIAGATTDEPMEIRGQHSFLNQRTRHFDSETFDRMIYQQSGAAHPPNGLEVASRSKALQPGIYIKDRRLFVHANPAIHLMHSRPKAWHSRKRAEIKARGSRKRWFGKVCGRLQFLIAWQRKEKIRQREARQRGHLPEQPDPQPRTFSRPLDLGDIPEAELPEEVRNNPGWLKACEYFRKTRMLADKDDFSNEEQQL